MEFESEGEVARCDARLILGASGLPPDPVRLRRPPTHAGERDVAGRHACVSASRSHRFEALGWIRVSDGHRAVSPSGPLRRAAAFNVLGVRLVALSIFALVSVAGCGGGGGSGTELEQGPAVAGFRFTDASAVAEGEPIDARYTCDGESLAPGLSWGGVPDGTQELALAVEDPDAPGATFTHWLVYGLDPRSADLPEGIPQETEVVALAGLRQGKNDFGDVGYGGPCPPGGEEHHYVFRLLALDAPLKLEPSADRAAFDDAVAPHVLAEARLTATYARG